MKTTEVSVSARRRLCEECGVFKELKPRVIFEESGIFSVGDPIAGQTGALGQVMRLSFHRGSAGLGGD